MSNASQPAVNQQTLAQNEAVETVLSRFISHEITIPPYQRDSDQWDDNKKSLFIESILNRLTVPAFYFAPNERNEQTSDVIDGQQRLTTMLSFFAGDFRLAEDDQCPYYGNSSHYAAKTYDELDDVWKYAFRRYNLTLVTLPSAVDLSLRLEIFRRINEGGTPLSGQDIRLSYYSESECVRFIQAVGIFDSSRPGAMRMIRSLKNAWPWDEHPSRQIAWKEWWNDSRAAIGQTAAEMFLWFIIGKYRTKVDDLLASNQSLANLRIIFRGNTDEVLDIACAQFKQDDLTPSRPRLFPSLQELQSAAFPEFSEWWHEIRMQCGPSANVAKNRSIALLIPFLSETFKSTPPSSDQWGFIGRFLKATRNTARDVLKIDFPESKGKWTSQHRQLQAYGRVAEEIAKR